MNQDSSTKSDASSSSSQTEEQASTHKETTPRRVDDAVKESASAKVEPPAESKDAQDKRTKEQDKATSRNLSKRKSSGEKQVSSLGIVVQPGEQAIATSEHKSILTSTVERKANKPSKRPEDQHLTVEELRGVFQSPEKGIFLMHQRSRRRIFVARLGLNRITPPPEGPVVILKRDEFLAYLSEEDPELAHSLVGKTLPEHVMVLEQLPLRQLRKTTIPRVLWLYWTWQVAGGLLCQWREKKANADDLRRQIGHTAFEGVRSLLERGRYLFDIEDDEEVAEHFVAWWGMMGYFAPHHRGDVFPAIDAIALDQWLLEQGMELEPIVEKYKPRVDVELPQYLPVPQPAPWLRWELHVEEDKRRAEPEPTQDLNQLFRQPNWGALVSLIMLLGMATGLLFLFQSRWLSSIDESMMVVEQLSGIHHMVMAPYSPYTIGLTLLGGLFFFLLGHLIDVTRIGRLKRNAYTTPSWLEHITQDDRQDARRTCEQMARSLQDAYGSDNYRSSGKTPIAEVTEAIVLGTFEWMRLFLWGSLLKLIPNNGLGIGWVARRAAQSKLRHEVFVFGHTLKRVLHERRCGNDVVAVQQLVKSIRSYRRLSTVKDRTLERLEQQRDRLSARIRLQFEDRAPAFIAPTRGAFLSLFLLLLVTWVAVLSLQVIVFYVLSGFILYTLISHFLDVTASIRREVYFWREPAWRRYIFPSELAEGREICMAHAQELWAQGEQQLSRPRSNSLLFEALSMLWSSLRWWAKVRLWGHLLTAFLFQWGKLVPLLRYAAQHILRKQIFEFTYHFHRALHAKERGNEVEAVLQLTEAIVFYQPFVKSTEDDLLLKQMMQLQNDLCDQIRDRFVQAHNVENKREQAHFGEMVHALVDVPLSSQLGRQCASMLKTLQRSYLDKDKQFYLTQVGRWLLSFGNKPLQGKLDHYGLVRSMQFIQSGIKKLANLPLTEEQREDWERPLISAQDYLDKMMRKLFGPKLIEALEEAGFVATTADERVCQQKMRDELLDLVIKNGRFSFSDVRDVISRNEMRLENPSWKELVTGDKLLKLNDAFEDRFHEIYREGEIYLRLLQRFSSLFFGTVLGRWLCRFIFIPYIGATVIIVFYDYLAHKLQKLFSPANVHKKDPVKWAELTGQQVWEFIWPVLLLGLLITLVVYTETGRKIFRLILNGIGNGIRFLLYEAPRKLIEQPFIQEALQHPRALYFYRHLALPFGLGVLLFSIEFGLMMAFMREWVTWRIMSLLFLGSSFLAYTFLNTTLGRAFLDRLVYRWLFIWQQIKDRWVIGLFWWIMDFFQAMLMYLEYFIYRGDDLLRFHRGEGQHVILFKAIGQVIWSVFTYIFRVGINLVFEPQVNPIKHFPVVTVSHKIISIFIPIVLAFMQDQGVSSPFFIGVVLLCFQFVFPGLFGFLAWELKENWKLFKANAPSEPVPVRLGPHGETMESLLRRGFHSGTLPRTFEKLHNYVHAEYVSMNRHKRHSLREELHHISHALDDFLERNLLAAIRQKESLMERFEEVGHDHPVLGINHIDMFFWLRSKEAITQKYLWRLRVELEGKWMIGSVEQLQAPTEEHYQLSLEEKKDLDKDLILLLRKSAIRLMRSKLETQLSFYLRSFSVGVPGEPTGHMRAEYQVKKEEIRVRVSAPNTDPQTIIYQLDEDARLREPAPYVALEDTDTILPRPAS